MKTKPSLETFLQEYEQHMLLALDEFIEKDEICGVGLPCGGWKDKDLLSFLSAIKKHGEILYKRFYSGGD